MSRPHGSRLPGEDYSKDKQCELVYGAGSVICPHMVSDGKLRREKSRLPSSDYCCQTPRGSERFMSRGRQPGVC